MNTLVPCFVCGKELEAVNHLEMQPYCGVMCDTSGNYGSRVLDGRPIMFLVCDDCLVSRKTSIKGVKTKTTKTVTYEEWEPNG